LWGVEVYRSRGDVVEVWVCGSGGGEWMYRGEWRLWSLCKCGGVCGGWEVSGDVEVYGGCGGCGGCRGMWRLIVGCGGI